MGKFKRKVFQPENLKRIRGVVRSFVDDHDGDDTRRFIKPKKKGPTRKERRKEEKQLKKLRKQAFSQKKKLPTKESLHKEAKERRTEELNKKRKAKMKRKKEEKRERQREEELQEEEAKEKEERDKLKAEDKEIKHLAKQLKLNKRKAKTLPQMFVNDGLDYLLEVTDSEKMKFMRDEGDEDMLPSKRANDIEADSSEEDYDEDEFGMDEDLDSEIDSDELPSDDDNNDEAKISIVHDRKPNIEGILKKGQRDTKKKVSFGNNSEDAISDEEDYSESGEDMEEGSEEESGEDCEDMLDDAGEDNEGLKEDIYGRLRDKEGNVVSSTAVTSGAYVPPAKRLQMAKNEDEKTKIQMERTKRKIKGLVNRLSEANMQSISAEIELLYNQISRALLTECLSDIIIEVCTGTSAVPDRLAMELTLLVAILHVNIGSEVGAMFLQSIVKLFEENFNLGGNYGQGKEMDNILLLLCHLCNFKVVHSLIIFDIFKRFISEFKDRDIEMILFLLKTVGFTIRKDDPMGLKGIIIDIQNKASSIDSSTFQDQSRVKFMLEILLAVKNNNMKKIPQYDPTPVENLRKTMKSIIRGGSAAAEPLKISLNDLLQADTKGRWWVVGSAWAGNSDRNSKDEDSIKPIVGDVSAEILELARKQRMNTDVRKNIFCVIMMCEDFADAFEKLLRLGLKSTQEREIIHVILDTALQERSFNPFYSHLLLKFCEYHKRFKMTLQFSFWDKFKELEQCTEFQINNMALTLTFLIITKAMSLAIFKVIEFADLDKPRVRLLKNVLKTLLMEHSEESSREAFLRIAQLPKLNVLREGLKLFMRHFMLKKSQPGVDMEVLKSRIDASVRTLSCSDSALGL